MKQSLSRLAFLAFLVVSLTLVSGFTPEVPLPEKFSAPVSARRIIHSQRQQLLHSDGDDNDSSLPVSPVSNYGNGARNINSLNRRSVLSSLVALLGAFSSIPTVVPEAIASQTIIDEGSPDGISAVTRSSLGTSIRRATVRSAQVADKLDERWERFSDSLRDENKCDPITGRRMFDNGFRKDGTRIGNPVLGGLCEPEPLLRIDDGVAQMVLGSAEAEAVAMLGSGKDAVRRKVADVDSLVGPSFARAKSSTDTVNEDDEKRTIYNRNVYSRMRAYGELLLSGKDPKSAKASAANFEINWGKRLLFDTANPLIPSRLANRNSFKSPFPPLTEEDKGDLAYGEGALLDGLGTVSAALGALQGGGIIGHWEISIPTDDFGEVVTIAVDDDISLGAQSLLREGRGGVALNGSVVTAITRAALGHFGVTAAIDTFFLDPSTTKQDVFNPSQLLLNLSNIKGS